MGEGQRKMQKLTKFKVHPGHRWSCWRTTLALLTRKITKLENATPKTHRRGEHRSETFPNPPSSSQIWAEGLCLRWLGQGRSALPQCLAGWWSWGSSSQPARFEQRRSADRFALLSAQSQMQNSCVCHRPTSVAAIWNSASASSWPQNRHINHQRSRICLSYWLCNSKLHDSFVQFYEDTMSIFHIDTNRWNTIPFLNSLFHKSIKGFLSIIF